MWQNSWPVSYTHLDVYKRQALLGASLWGRSLYWDVAVLVGLGLALLLTLYLQKKLGGITGDCLGTASEMGEIGFLLALRVISVWG